jgi:hypothetical protein
MMPMKGINLQSPTRWQLQVRIKISSKFEFYNLKLCIGRFIIHMIDFSDWVAKELVAELLGPNPELVNPELVDPDGTADPLGTQVEVPDPAPVVDQVEEDDLDAIDTDSMYMLLILQRQKRFNLVEVLRNLEIPSGGKAHMDIPLCRMASLQVVRPALINDIQKLQVDFVHGYRVGAVVFYVLLTNMRGEGSMVSDVDRASWDEH